MIIIGTKYPVGKTPFWPPRDWTCPECGKYHSKAHFAHPGQLDRNINVGNYGRVKFNRADKYGSDTLDYSQPIRKDLIGKQGPMILEDKVQGLFCPHCGWEEYVINIIIGKEDKGWTVIEAPDCCIKDCNRKAKMKNKNGLNFCKECYVLVK